MFKNIVHLRNDFPILSQTVNGNPLAYLDNASTTQKRQQMLDAIIQFYTTYNANTGRGLYAIAEKATQQYEQIRHKVAQFIGAKNTSEIIFTRGCTSGINFVAATWGKEHITLGDEIVLTELEHHANLLPWQRLAKQNGAALRFIPVLPDGTLDLSNLASIITPKTKLVSMLDVSNALGTHIDVATISAQAKKVGAKVLIDAAQSIAHQQIDVQKLGCDFLVFSGHKMLGPTGVGVLYIKKELHDETPPYELGGGMVFQARFTDATWLPAPQKFEAGTLPIAQVIGLGAAIDYLNTSINFNELQKYEAQLCSQLIDALSTIQRIRLLGPINQLKKCGHLVSFVVDGIHAHDVATFLGSKGICVRAGHHCAQPFTKKLGYDVSVRTSFYLYNTPQEVDRLITTIKELTE